MTRFSIHDRPDSVPPENPAEIEARDEAKGERCRWADDDDGIWRTECGGAWTLMAGTPTDNGMGWCPYCGRPLVEVSR